MATKVTKEDKEKKEKKTSISKKTTKASTTKKTTTKAKSTSKSKSEIKPKKIIKIATTTKAKSTKKVQESLQGTATFPFNIYYKYLEEGFNNLAVLQWLNSIHQFTWSISTKSLGYNPVKIVSAISGGIMVSTEIQEKSYLILTTEPAITIYCVSEAEFKKLANIKTSEQSNTKYETELKI